MRRTRFPMRALVVGLFASAFAGCGGSFQPGARAAADPNEVGFVASDGWAFPAGSIQPTLATGGIVTTTDRVATETGTEILRRGGNAVDAAVATHFALAVVNPEAGNIGGGGFMVVRRANGETASLDFREKAPGAATRDMYLDERGEVTDASRSGHLAAGVPGSVAGMWEAHQRFGSLPWAELVQPAINLALGMVVHDRLAGSLRSYAERLERNPAAAAVLLPGGTPPPVGDRLVQADLAETFRRIAENGKDGFYGGQTALLVEEEMRRGGGLITANDLASYEAVWRDPIVFSYRGHTIISMPPPSSGGATLAEILNILEGYDLASLSHHSADHVHLWTEAVKRAYVDRNAYLADPDFAELPTERMISDDYAAERRSDIHPDRTTPSDSVLPGLTPVPAVAMATPEPEHTTHYSIIDADGNAVAVTTTLNSLYGNVVMVEDAGFLLNNEMDDFTAKVGEPNQFGLVQGEANTIEPGKRMLSAMTPTIVLDPNGSVLLVTGTPGGSTIITSVAQVISNVIDFGMGVANATAAPRLHHQHLPDVLRYEENGLPVDVVAALEALGHEVDQRSGFQGDLQTIQVLPGTTTAGVADPRRGGASFGVTPVRQVVQ
ncbi:MAG: gamma-glutamyltransferase [Gemmatimonas sp.]|nr:gamma-glutamyltransferase [Gemmatimonas sp.]